MTSSSARLTADLFYMYLQMWTVRFLKRPLQQGWDTGRFTH